MSRSRLLSITTETVSISNTTHKARGSFNVTLFSDTHTLNLIILILNFQCVSVAKEGNIKRATGLIAKRNTDDYYIFLQTKLTLFQNYFTASGSPVDLILPKFSLFDALMLSFNQKHTIKMLAGFRV